MSEVFLSTQACPYRLRSLDISLPLDFCSRACPYKPVHTNLYIWIYLSRPKHSNLYIQTYASEPNHQALHLGYSHVRIQTDLIISIRPFHTDLTIRIYLPTNSIYERTRSRWGTSFLHCLGNCCWVVEMALLIKFFRRSFSSLVQSRQ